MMPTEFWPDVIDRFDDYAACYEAMGENVTPPPGCRSMSSNTL